VPLTCQDIDQACGSYDDGCGGTIECDAGCECTPETADSDCPPRPCEEATGCEESKCVYEPIRCGGEPCVCRGDECEMWTLRSCGDGTCTEQFCDPRPTRDDDGIHYENACVAAPVVGACGLCGLGAHICDPETDTLECSNIEIVEFLGVDPDAVECDSDLPASSFIFVDTEYDGIETDGSREAPFVTYDDAMAVARVGDALGIIIAGTPTFRARPELEEGISVFGGFDGAPHFRANRDNKVTWEVGLELATANELDDHRIAGAVVRDVEQATVLANLVFRTDSLAEGDPVGAGWSNHGFVATDSPGLRLVRIDIEAGDAGDGEAGAEGTVGQAGNDGIPGEPAVSCDCTDPPPSEWHSCDDVTVAGGAGGADSTCLDIADLSGGGAGGSHTGDVGNCLATSGGDSDAGTYGGYGGWSNTNPGWPGDSAANVPPTQAAPGSVVTHPVLAEDGVFFVISSAADGAGGQFGASAEGGSGGATGYGASDPFPGCQTSPAGCTRVIIGGGGGGGGSGGCGGNGGEGGRGGGVSVGLVASGSAGMVLRDCTVTAGNGGTGGDAGAGGPGGPGGAAGPGGTVNPAFCTGGLAGICGPLAGSAGGRGGDGGPGGAGGNGAGGSAFGAHCVDSPLVAQGLVLIQAGEAAVGGQIGERPGPTGLSIDQFACVPVCGNGVTESPEECDDGNTVSGDGCESDCTLACGASEGAVSAAIDPVSDACLAAFDAARTWEEAELACVTLGGHLASLTTEAERDLATLLLPGQSFHIGLSDQAEEGTFTWQTGETLGFTAWCGGGPAGGDDEDCVLAFWADPSSSHCWVDMPCDVAVPYVCEY
jgi:cysteine-rich repeat protein